MISGLIDWCAALAWCAVPVQNYNVEWALCAFHGLGAPHLQFSHPLIAKLLPWL